MIVSEYVLNLFFNFYLDFFYKQLYNTNEINTGELVTAG